MLNQQQENGLVTPITYVSHTFQKHEQNYGVTELEALGIVLAIRHFRPYLNSHACKVHTDLKPLNSLLNTPHPLGKLARWGLAIQELVRYRLGKANQAADALSCQKTIVQVKDRDASICHLVASNDKNVNAAESLALQQDLDNDLRVIKHYLLTNQLRVERVGPRN